MDKQTVVYPYNRLLLSKKMGKLVDLCNNMDESQNSYAEWEKSEKEEYVLYDSTYIKFYKMQTIVT